MKKILPIILAIAISFFAVSCGVTHDIGEEILKNTVFTQAEGAQTPDSWSYEMDSNTTVATGNDQNGDRYIRISNTSNAHAYVYQTVKLQKGEVYKVSAKIKVPTTITGNVSFVGAYVGFKQNLSAIPKTIVSGKSEYQNYVYYFRAVDYSTADLVLGLGTEDRDSKGDAYFSSVSLTRVDETALGGATIYELTAPKGGITDKTAKGAWYTAIMALLTLVVVGVGIYAIKAAMSKRDEADEAPKSFFKRNGIIILVILNALLIRVLFATLTYGSSSVNSFMNWADRLATNGPKDFYTYFANAECLPVLGYMAWIMGYVVKLFSAEGIWALFIARIPMIVCDTVTVYTVYRIGRKHYKENIALVLSLVYAFLPVAFTMAGIWGTGEAVTAMFVLLAFDKLLDKRFVSFSVYYGLALATTIIASYLLPVVLAYYVYIFIKEKDNRLTLVLSVVGVFLSIYVLALPYVWDKLPTNILYYYSHMVDLFSARNYYTMNVPNIYALFGLNYSIVSNASKWLNILLVALISAFTIFVYLKNRNRTELVLLSAFQLAMVYTFAVRMNPAVIMSMLLLVLFYAIVANEKRMYFVFCGYSFISMMVGGSVIALSEVFGATSAITSFASLANGSAWLIILAVLTVALTVYFAYVVYDICINNRRDELEEFSVRYKTGGIRALLKRK